MDEDLISNLVWHCYMYIVLYILCYAYIYAFHIKLEIEFLKHMHNNISAI